MESLQKYCMNKIIIDGLKTYIVPFEYYENIQHDTELLEELGINNDIIRNAISLMIKNTKLNHKIKIHLAFVRHENRKIHIWEPVNVYEHENHFYHVSVGRAWLCRKCQHVHMGNIIMPMAEADTIFLERQYLNSFVVPDIFKKIPCEKCGNLLQRHLLIIK